MSSTLKLARHISSIQKRLDAVARLLAVRKRQKSRKSKSKGSKKTKRRGPR
jgi:hypothetical protein